MQAQHQENARGGNDRDYDHDHDLDHDLDYDHDHDHESQSTITIITLTIMPEMYVEAVTYGAFISSCRSRYYFKLYSSRCIRRFSKNYQKRESFKIRSSVDCLQQRQFGRTLLDVTRMPVVFIRLLGLNQCTFKLNRISILCST